MCHDDGEAKKEQPQQLIPQEQWSQKISEEDPPTALQQAT
jgi:hypothetical protein